MKAIVIVSQHWNDTITEPQVSIGNLPLIRPRQKLTEQEYGLIPEQFKCFCCQQTHKKRDIGGILMFQRLCKFCYPWLDEWSVGCMIKFDLWHGQQVTGY